jgi:hypothetical protein
MAAYARLPLIRLLGIFLVSTTLSAYAAPDDLDAIQEKLSDDWVIIKNDKFHNIKTYAKQERGKPYRLFRVEAILDSTVEVGVRVLLDADNYTKWYWNVTKSKMLKTVSSTEYYLYLIHNSPVSIPDRDVILNLVIELQKKPSDPIVVRVKAEPTYIPESPPLVRMPAENMVFYAIPLPNQKVKIYAQGYIDLGESLPEWANNYIQRNAPYATLLGLLRVMTSDTYRYAKDPLPFKVYNSPDGR